MIRISWLVMIALLVGLANWQAAAAPAKKTAKKTAKAKTSAKKRTTAAGSSTKGRTTAKSRRARSTAPQRPAQARPSEERIREIQTALKTRGYLEQEPDGNWGTTSSAALKRFQQDQNIIDDGRIGALSLIALGLGPKRDKAPLSAPDLPGVEVRPQQ